MKPYQNNNSQNEDPGLTKIIFSLLNDTHSKEMRVGDIFQTIQHRGFGALLVAPALLIILPTGAIPGLPAICAVFIILISLQDLSGQSQPWLPNKLKNVSFSREKFESGFEKIKPYTKKIDKYVHHRLEFLAKSRVSKLLLAVFSILLSIGIIFLGFIPMLSALLALPILFFSLGMSIRDGLLIAVGYSLQIITFVSLPLLV